VRATRLPRGVTSRIFSARRPGRGRTRRRRSTSPRRAPPPCRCSRQNVETRVTGLGANPIASVTAVPASPTSAAIAGSAVPSQAASSWSCVIPASRSRRAPPRRAARGSRGPWRTPNLRRGRADDGHLAGYGHGCRLPEVLDDAAAGVQAAWDEADGRRRGRGARPSRPARSSGRRRRGSARPSRSCRRRDRRGRASRSATVPVRAKRRCDPVAVVEADGRRRGRREVQGVRP